MHLNGYIDGENIDTFIQEFYSKILMDSVLVGYQTGRY